MKHKNLIIAGWKPVKQSIGFRRVFHKYIKSRDVYLGIKRGGKWWYIIVQYLPNYSRNEYGPFNSSDAAIAHMEFMIE